MITVYGVFANTDTTEGRGRMALLHLWWYEDSALSMARGLGPMGASNGDVRPMIVYDSKEEYLQLQRPQIGDILNRLSIEEQKVLKHFFTGAP